MMKILCTSVEHLPATLALDEQAFTLFKGARRPRIGTIARGWRGSLKRKGFAPSPQAWDFVQFCLSVCAADLACLRRTTSDGWTRTIELTVGLHEPIRWAPWKSHVEEMLKVLTGDYWTLNFIDGGVAPPDGKPQPIDGDCVSLLSGGLDSLIGGIDLVSSGRNPLFVSQLAHEDSDRQRRYAQGLGSAGNHMQWSHGISFSGPRESSTRGRSLAFYGFAILAASRIKSSPVQVFIPENGFISINPPLVPGRVASLSTRTTHPLFISMLQELLSGLGLNIQLELPYSFKSKGEMLRECKDQALLSQWASDSTSCGRFRTYNRRHCGRCVPCIVRKSSFIAWGSNKDGTDYVYPNLAVAEKKSGPDDPMAVALAVLNIRDKGLNSFLGASLAFAPPSERSAYRRMLMLGFSELETLLAADQLL